MSPSFPSDHFLCASEVARLLEEIVKRRKAIFNEGYRLPYRFGEIEIPEEGRSGETFSLEEKCVLFKTLLILRLGHFVTTLVSPSHMEPFLITLYKQANCKFLLTTLLRYNSHAVHFTHLTCTAILAISAWVACSVSFGS